MAQQIIHLARYEHYRGINRISRTAGTNTLELPVAELSSGAYNLTLIISGKPTINKLIMRQ